VVCCDPIQHLVDRGAFGQPTQLRGQILLQRLPVLLGPALQAGMNVIWHVTDQYIRHAYIMQVSELARHVLSDVANDRPDNRVRLELHRALLGTLLTDLGPVRERAHRSIEQMRASVRGPQAQAWLDEWSELVDEAGPRLGRRIPRPRRTQH
jgi:hypothetical protein